MFKHKDIIQVEMALNKNLNKLCDWFVDNKWSIYFSEEKAKSLNRREAGGGGVGIAAKGGQILKNT